MTGYGPGSLTAITLPVQDIGRSSRQVWTWLPPGTTETSALPVLYLLPGQNESPRVPFLHGIAQALTNAFAAGRQPFELAVPEGLSTSHSDPEWADAWDGSDRLETFVGAQVIPAVEGSSLRPRSLRGIAGFSMGGYGAAVMAARQKAVFGQFVGLAGYYVVDDPQGVLGPNPTYRYVHSPISRASQYARTRVLLLADTDDEGSRLFAGAAFRMRDVLALTGHRPGAAVTPGAHSWGWVNAQWALATLFLSQGWGHS